MYEITKQSVLKAFQEEKSISWGDFSEKEIFFDIGRKVKDQKTSDFTKVVCAKLLISPICCLLGLPPEDPLLFLSLFSVLSGNCKDNLLRLIFFKLRFIEGYKLGLIEVSKVA
jgi:hypothetical protein